MQTMKDLSIEFKTYLKNVYDKEYKSRHKKNNEEYNIDTKSLATGAYILLINDGKSTSHKKFIKQ
jgi:hypothetical protein